MTSVQQAGEYTVTPEELINFVISQLAAVRNLDCERTYQTSAMTHICSI